MHIIIHLYITWDMDYMHFMKRINDLDHKSK